MAQEQAVLSEAVKARITSIMRMFILVLLFSLPEWCHGAVLKPIILNKIEEDFQRRIERYAHEGWDNAKDKIETVEDHKELCQLLKWEDMIWDIRREYYRACADRYQSADFQIRGFADRCTEKFFNKQSALAEEAGLKAKVGNK